MLVICNRHLRDGAGNFSAQWRYIGAKERVVSLLKATAPDPAVPSTGNSQKNTRRESEDKYRNELLKAQSPLCGKARIGYLIRCYRAF